MSPTRLSVLTPSYNYAAYVAQCLSSVQRQAPNQVAVEHVIVDDGSTDDSWGLLQRLHDGSGPLERHENRGLGPTLNRALDLASGEWMLWLNADDFLLPYALGVFSSALAFAPDADLVFGDTLFVDQRSRLLRLVAQPAFDRVLFKGGYNSFHVPSVFWRKARLGRTGFDETLQLLIDLDAWLTMTGPPVVVVKADAPLSAVRRHPAQISATERPEDAIEMQTLARRHGLHGLESATTSRSRRRARLRHAALKAVHGAWMREARVWRHRGEFVDWTTGAQSRLLLPPSPRFRVSRVR